jgi:hypothetical protein
MSDETQYARSALVGDARQIVARTSRMMPTRDHLEALVEALDEALGDSARRGAMLDDCVDDLRELREEGCRMTQHIARLEAANTRLHQCLEAEQRERELLAASVGHALGELAEYFNRANELRGKGTPRDDRPHSLSLHEPRDGVAGAIR